jgi:hypothetical protein
MYTKRVSPVHAALLHITDLAAFMAANSQLFAIEPPQRPTPYNPFPQGGDFSFPLSLDGCDHRRCWLETSQRTPLMQAATQGDLPEVLRLAPDFARCTVASYSALDLAFLAGHGAVAVQLMRHEPRYHCLANRFSVTSRHVPPPLPIERIAPDSESPLSPASISVAAPRLLDLLEAHDPSVPARSVLTPVKFSPLTLVRTMDPNAPGSDSASKRLLDLFGGAVVAVGGTESVMTLRRTLRNRCFPGAAGNASLGDSQQLLSSAPEAASVAKIVPYIDKSPSLSPASQSAAEAAAAWLTDAKPRLEAHFPGIAAQIDDAIARLSTGIHSARRFR